METTTRTPIQEKRDLLKEYSKAVKPLVSEGKYETINEAIIKEVYDPNGELEFKTYDQWKSEGKQVRKGEKAFLVWGKPKSAQEQKEQEPQEQEEETDKFYPLCFLFSNLQVD